MIQRPSAFRPMSAVRPAVSARPGEDLAARPFTRPGTDLAARPFTTAARP